MHNLHAVLEHLVHVVILVLHIAHHAVFPIAPVHLIGSLGHGGLALLEALHAVIPDDVDHGGLFHLAAHLLEMEEALIAIRAAGGLQGGQQGVELHGHQQGVFHLVLGRAGMDAEAVDRDMRHGCIEGLVFKVRNIAAVQGVGKVRTEALHVEVAGAPADLLVRREAQADLAMGSLFRQQLFHRLENDGHAGLVVGTQQRGAVGADQILAHKFGKFREPGRLHDDVFLLVEDDVSALVVNDLGLDVLSGEIRRGVHMGNETDGGQMLASRRSGNGGIDIARLVHKSIVDAQAMELLHQKIGHIKFRGIAGRSALAVIIAFAEYLGVPDQPVDNRIHYASSCSSLSRFSGFRHWSSSGRNRPSLRMSTSSNQISPPPYSGVWIWIRSQCTAEWLPLEALS